MLYCVVLCVLLNLECCRVVAYYVCSVTLCHIILSCILLCFAFYRALFTDNSPSMVSWALLCFVLFYSVVGYVDLSMFVIAYMYSYIILLCSAVLCT